MTHSTGRPETPLPAPAPRALLVHRGGLEDVREVLAGLGLDVFERAGLPSRREMARGWELVVCRPTLVPELVRDASGRRPPCIAVVDAPSRSATARLRRADVDFVVSRPLHPEALKLLVLRAVYRGPERRAHLRVPALVPVRLHVGLRRLRATLRDLSVEGARVRIRGSLRADDRPTLLLPRALAGGPWRTALRARVLRVTAVDHGAREASLVFEAIPARARARLETAVDRLGREGAGAAPDGPGEERPDATPGGPPAAAERRRWPRRSFRRRVILLGEEAARVLVGRDLSLGGMRVEPGAALQVGERVRLAIHAGVSGPPAVVEAEVVRDEGSAGWVLRFAPLGERERSYLEATLSGLPAATDPLDRSGLVLSRIL